MLASKTFMVRTLARLQRRGTLRVRCPLLQMQPLLWPNSTTNWAQIGILMLYGSLTHSHRAYSHFFS